MGLLSMFLLAENSFPSLASFCGSRLETFLAGVQDISSETMGSGTVDFFGNFLSINDAHLFRFGPEVQAGCFLFVCLFVCLFVFCQSISLSAQLWAGTLGEIIVMSSAKPLTL